MPSRAHVTVDIGWHEAVKAVETLAGEREVERLSIYDVQKIAAISQVIWYRLKEAGLVKGQVVDVAEHLSHYASQMTPHDIQKAIEDGEATFMGMKLVFETQGGKQYANRGVWTNA